MVDVPSKLLEKIQSPPFNPASVINNAQVTDNLSVPPKTLDEMMRDSLTETQNIGYSFDLSGGLNKNFNHLVKNEDFLVNSDDKESLIATAQSIKSMAEMLGIRLEDIAELKAVMNYDKNSDILSDQELGAYLLAKTAGKVEKLDRGVTLSAEYTAKGAQDPALSSDNLQVIKEIGQQIFGDNYPEISSRDTVNNSPKNSKIGRTK